LSLVEKSIQIHEINLYFKNSFKMSLYSFKIGLKKSSFKMHHDNDFILSSRSKYGRYYLERINHPSISSLIHTFFRFENNIMSHTLFIYKC